MRGSRLPRRSQRGDRGSIISAGKDGGTRYEHVGSRSENLCGIVDLDPAVHFEERPAVYPVDHLPGVSHFLQAGRNA